MVYHIPLTARSGPFNHFTMISLKKGTDQPFSRRSRPFQEAIFHFIGQVYCFCNFFLSFHQLIGCNNNQRQTSLIPNLSVRDFLQILIRCNWIFDILNIYFQPILCISKRLLDIFNFLGELLPSLQLECFRPHIFTSNLIIYPWPSKRPARRICQVYSHPEAFSLVQGIYQHLHPFWRQIIDKSILFTFNSIYRSYLNAS